MMSLLSRFFGKAPLPVSGPPSSSHSEPPHSAAESRANEAPTRSRVPDRGVAAAVEEQALHTALEQRDTPAIARLVVTGTSTRIRQQAAHAIEDPDVLRQLIRDVRGGNDKSVYKILTAKRDALLLQTRKLEQLRAEISAVGSAIERHSQRAHDPLYGPTLEQLETRWKAVAAEAPAQIGQKVQKDIDCSREVIAAHLRTVAAMASKELAAANAAAEAQRLREAEEKAAMLAAAEQARVLEEQRRAEADKREAEQLALRQVGGLIRKAREALNDGSTGRAAGLRRAIAEKASAVPALPPYLSSQVQQLDSRLDELKDWKTFSVGPKRTELMAEMEALAGADLDPPVLAERIRGLQEQWRTLSKGAGENLEEDWQRFHEAAQKAYQPCREYFETQSLVRQENLRRRAALLERLTSFEAEHDWEHPDWKRVITALRESRQEWRRHSPVDRAPGKELQERFVAVTAGLQRRLEAEYERNVKQKESLIERARYLLGSEDSRKAIEAVKDLQQKWRAVGPVARDVDQRLWEEFRQQSDAIYQKRQQEFAAYSAGLEGNKARAGELCAQLDEIAELSGPTLLERAQALAEMRTTFEAIGELPRADARGLYNRFERALERCEHAVAQQHVRDAERSWVDLFYAADRVRSYRLTLVHGADATQQDAARQAAETYIAGVQHWPKGALEAIKQGLAGTDSRDMAANEAALKMLCIRAEILADIPTPPGDQPIRREYQVQRLMQSMGQGIKADETTLDTLAIEWVRVGPVEDILYGALLERFRRCRERSFATSVAGIQGHEP